MVGDATSNRSPKLEVRGITKVFGQRGQSDGHLALENINLHLQPNELACLIGSSGCGKSTLLNIMAGLLPATDGEILVDGHPVLGPGPDRGMIFQSYTLYPWMTVARNIGFGLRLRGVGRRQEAEIVEKYLEIVGLESFAKAFPHELSGGMKQRVAIARALSNEPEVVLMDEPFGALDAQNKAQMQEFLLQLWERTHTTIFMITHDVEEAIYLSRRVYVMGKNPGHIKIELPIDLPEQRYPDLKFEQKFVGIKKHVLEVLHDDE